MGKKFFVIILLCFNVAAILLGHSYVNTTPLEKKTVHNAFISEPPRPYKPNPEIIREILRKYGKGIKETAQDNNLTPQTIAAIISIESGGNPFKVGRKGEIGCMQILPATAKFIETRTGYKGNLYDCFYNMRVGAKYLAYIRDLYVNQYKLSSKYLIVRVIIGYNNGPENARYFTDEQLANHEYSEAMFKTLKQISEYW